MVRQLVDRGRWIFAVHGDVDLQDDPVPVRVHHAALILDKAAVAAEADRLGLFVTGLKRVRSGNVPLGGLPLGKWRYLRPDEKF